MRAVILSPPDGTAIPVRTEVLPVPKPGPDEVLVKVAYAGCNFADTMMRRGVYPHPKGYPLVAGLELAGTVEALGKGVTGWAAGDLVAAFVEDAGAFAEYCVVPAERLVRLPEGVGLDVAAACFLQALTAWHLLHNVSTTHKGDVLLIHAIGGGVGLYLTQLAAKAGATVLGTVGTRGKDRRALEWGASRVVLRSEEDFRKMVAEETGGRGVDKILDSTGGSILDGSFESIRNLGHIVSYGEAEGKPFPNLWERLVRRSLTFTRLHLGHVDARSEAWVKGAKTVIGMVADGSLKVPIEGVFALEEAGVMFDRLESRQVAGKLILKICA